MKHLKTVTYCTHFSLIFSMRSDSQIIRIIPYRFSEIITDSTIQKLFVRMEIVYKIVGHIEEFIQINGMGKNFEKSYSNFKS